MVRALTCSLVLWGACCASPVAAEVVIDLVTVGNAGNAPDKAYASANNPNLLQLGAVDYEFQIGRTEVTNAQYVEFLNAKAKSDPLLLYDTRMGTEASGGITRSGDDGNYTYEVKPNFANKPINYVNCYDAYRFVNWLQNGQGDGDTETGAYTLGPYNPGGYPVDAGTIVRNPGAQWFIPNEHEWYKAAYYDPRSAAEGGPAGDDHYWYFATRSDALPTAALADEFGNISNPGANVVNYELNADWNGQDGNVTTVGSAGPLSESYYGTSDQGGNVWEWVDTQYGDQGWGRGLRGGAYHINPYNGAASERNIAQIATGSYPTIGFRVAAAAVAVPEPSSLALAGIGLIGALLGWSRRRRG